MENSADTRETKVAKSSGGIFHVPTVNDLHEKHHEKGVSSERKPKRGKHENSISKTRSAARTEKSSQQNGLANVSEYQLQYKVTSIMNSGSSRSNIFKGRTFSFSNSFSHDKVCMLLY
jgi:topoisomerase (DNA) II binding protein 1